MINVRGIDKAEVLAALYNASRPLGMGMIRYTPKPMTVAEARDIIGDTAEPYFDYLKGRVMKLYLADEIDPRLYDRDNGPGAAEAALLDLLTRPASK